jgi:chromodomain-helicase-DNA-binding protein 4
MLRRLKSIVLKEALPTKKWVEVPCALTEPQRELYIDILEKNYAKLNRGIQSGGFKLSTYRNFRFFELIFSF